MAQRAGALLLQAAGEPEPPEAEPPAPEAPYTGEEPPEPAQSRTNNSMGYSMRDAWLLWVIGYWTGMFLSANDNHVWVAMEGLLRHWIFFGSMGCMILFVGLTTWICRQWRRHDYDPIQPHDDLEDAESRAQREENEERALRDSRQKPGGCCGRCKAHCKLFYRRNKRWYNIFKHQPIGIIILERWLKLQDVGSDVVVTIGLWAGEDDDWWWARLSLFFLLNTPILLWIVTAPIFHKQMTKKGVQWWLAGLLWLVFGLPTVIILDLVMLFMYPWWEPRAGWLSNVFRLQKLAEATLEAPTQMLLQCWIFFETTFVEHRQGFKVPYGLLVSIGTSLFTFALTLYDIKELADAQRMPFLDCLEDILLVGLERRAPLLHILRLRTEVEYDDEGSLSAVHCEQIAAVAASCQNLRKIRFGMENDLDLDKLSFLLASVPGTLEVTSRDFMYNGREQHFRLRLGVEKIEHRVWRRLLHLRTLELRGNSQNAFTVEQAEQLEHLIQSLTNLESLHLRTWMTPSTNTEVGHFVRTALVCARLFRETKVHLTRDDLQHKRYRQGDKGSYTGPEQRLSLLHIEDIPPGGWELFTELQHLQTVELGSEQRDPLTPEQGQQIALLAQSLQDLHVLRLMRGVTVSSDALRTLIVPTGHLRSSRRVDVEIVDQLEYNSQTGRLVLRPGSPAVRTDIGSHLHAIQVLEALFRQVEGVDLSSASPLLQQLNDGVLQKYELDGGRTYYDSESRKVQIAALKQVGPEGCSQLKELRQLLQLSIRDCNHIGADGCAHLKELQQLSHLSIGGFNEIGAEGCSHLKEMRQLLHLSICKENKIGADGCGHLKELQHLSHLRIGHQNEVGAEACRHLKELRQLLQLSIGYHNNIGADGCAHLKDGVPRLQKLTLATVGNEVEGAAATGFLDELRRRGVDVNLPDFIL